MTFPVPIRTPFTMRAVGSVGIGERETGLFTEFTQALAKGADVEIELIAASEASSPKSAPARSKPPITGTPMMTSPNTLAIVLDQRDRRLGLVVDEDVEDRCRSEVTSDDYQHVRQRESPPELELQRVELWVDVLFSMS
jgi:hypothetical protein